MLRRRHLVMTCRCQGITVYGLTGRITLLGPLSISSLSREGAPSRERYGGGLAVTGLTIGKNFTRSHARREPPNPIQLH